MGVYPASTGYYGIIEKAGERHSAYFGLTEHGDLETCRAKAEEWDKQKRAELGIVRVIRRRRFSGVSLAGGNSSDAEARGYVAGFDAALARCGDRLRDFAQQAAVRAAPMDPSEASRILSGIATWLESMTGGMPGCAPATVEGASDGQ